MKKYRCRAWLAGCLAVLLLASFGCGKDAGNISTEDPTKTEIPQDPVLFLADVPTEHRPEISDPSAREKHGVSMSAVYTVPNGIEVSVHMLNGAETGSLTLSRMPIFEKYTAGEWVPMSGQKEIAQAETMDTCHFLAPLQLHFALPRFPEAGVYRCAILCGGEMSATHYTYFEVPEYTRTVPTEADVAKAVQGDSQGPVLTVTAKDVTPTSLTLVLTEHATDRFGITFGENYRLLCHIDGEWRPVAMRNSSFIAIARYMEIDGEEELQVDLSEHLYPLEPGHYRFEKTFTAPYFVCFEIPE